MTTDRKSIKVKIFGSEYPLRGDSEEFTRRVAAHVDDMISSIHARIPDQPTLTVAVLSALNITEDLLKERERSKSALSMLESELSRMTSFMDSCLNDAQGTLSS
jgi:cell division protein ZapA (FtsZ GTPase activity inhibitor)